MMSVRPAGPPRPSPDVGARAWLTSLRERFELAAEEVGVEERFVRVAAVPGRLLWAGSGIDSLLTPFEHLETARADSPDFGIRLFDSACTGIEAPDFPWPLPSSTAGAVPFARVVDGDVCVVRDVVVGTQIAIDRDAGEAILHTPDATQDGLLEQAALLRDAIQALLLPRRWLVHAAAVGGDDRGALLVGASGSGKSTLSLSCALAGMGIAGDDYAFLEPDKPPRAHAWASTAKLTRDGAGLLGLASDRVEHRRFQETAEGLSKAVIELDEIVPGRRRESIAVTALVAPRLSARAVPRLTELAPPAVLRALAPSTAFQSRVALPGMLGALGDLVRETPAYELKLCETVEANAEAVAEAIDRHA